MFDKIDGSSLSKTTTVISAAIREKVNKIADALSQKSTVTLTSV